MQVHKQTDIHIMHDAQAFPNLTYVRTLWLEVAKCHPLVDISTEPKPDSPHYVYGTCGSSICSSPSGRCTSVFVCMLHVPLCWSFVPSNRAFFLVCHEWPDTVCDLPNLKHSFRECEYLGCQIGTNLATLYKPLCSDGARLVSHASHIIGHPECVSVPLLYLVPRTHSQLLNIAC